MAKGAYIGVETPVTVLICPSCGSDDIRKSPVDCTCMDCGYSGPASDFEQTTVKSVARKIKKMYIGVLGVARKVKKAYIGIDGVARPCWSGGELTYYGTIDSIGVARNRIGSTTVGNYALFAGGLDGSVSMNNVTVYDTSLTKTTATALSAARPHLAATTIGEYAIFGGGIGYYDNPSKIVDAYDSSLTRTTPTALSTARGELAATTVGNYALFAGGRINPTPTFSNTVDAYTLA